MRKLKLDAEKLVVESFDSVDVHDDEKGTVHGNETAGFPGCTQPTNDPRLRECVTPYIDCATDGWTCIWCGGPISPTTIC
jgi:hypothetical protein